ncbi:methylated-DNA--[protein]-cysteine S-methyltransferase [Brevundimonas fluminis]|jgi:methylated-DNA-[protein]-cysteine S-methyltransferase|uniref:methylated-DNA--[protein]-cysteine S-methyltransferase n=1 Tax=Brevundimonas fluminis TaxID=2487274 RepID=UPI000F656644|nr:methylated-DNA--[protein]-cysteine S-methyltransferase [Brevundimonas fluminis]
MRPELTLDRLATPVGEMLVVTDAGGAVRALDFADYEPRMLRLLARHWGPVDLTPGRAPDRVRDAIAAYFAGDLTALDRVPVKTNGTTFQKDVWSALRSIPAGETVSYGALAARIGRPRAVRAVGLANGRNPVGVIVPCHRVIGANGTLTGYAGGVERKRALLAHEGVMV